MTLGGIEAGEPDFHVMLNMGFEDLPFELPPLNGKVWKSKIDTSQLSPWDFTEEGQEPAVDGGHYIVNRHSIVVLLSEAVTPEAKAEVEERRAPEVWQRVQTRLERAGMSLAGETVAPVRPPQEP